MQNKIASGILKKLAYVFRSLHLDYLKIQLENTNRDYTKGRIYKGGRNHVVTVEEQHTNQRATFLPPSFIV
jgi:hypothetical protein